MALSGLRARGWTDGCIAVTDQELEEIWKLVDNGTGVEIRP
jgi:L,D-peptidoglycan transpeptidase YkuD (ErfK/YbiS/YcfS/YnhG family)